MLMVILLFFFLILMNLIFKNKYGQIISNRIRIIFQTTMTPQQVRKRGKKEAEDVDQTPKNDNNVNVFEILVNCWKIP